MCTILEHRLLIDSAFLLHAEVTGITSTPQEKSANNDSRYSKLYSFLGKQNEVAFLFIFSVYQIQICKKNTKVYINVSLLYKNNPATIGCCMELKAKIDQ